MSEEQDVSLEPVVSAEDMHTQRLQKAARLQEAGLNLYGQRVTGLTSIEEARNAFLALPEGSATSSISDLPAPEWLAGSWAIVFPTQGSSGSLQLYVQKNEVGDEAYELFKDFDIGDILSASGYVFRTRTGEVSLHVRTFTLLSKGLRALPEKYHGLRDTEQRYRQRYVDLIMNDEVRRTFELRSKIIAEIRNYLHGLGFMEVETPMMQTLAGGAAAQPFKTFYNALGCTMYLRIAPELFLKRLLVGGFEKVFEIGSNFRNEGMDRRHNPEFTCLELYQAYSDCRGMMKLLEDISLRSPETIGTPRSLPQRTIN